MRKKQMFLSNLMLDGNILKSLGDPVVIRNLRIEGVQLGGPSGATPTSVALLLSNPLKPDEMWYSLTIVQNPETLTPSLLIRVSRLHEDLTAR